MTDEPEDVPIPIDGTLDLHTFRPQEISALLEAYFEACRERGILDVRVIHGKGTGTLRRTVETLLRRDPQVERFSTGGEGGGSWGATVVRLRRP